MNAPRSGCPINLTLEALGGSLEPDRHPRPDVRQPPSLPRVADPVGGADASNILADRLTRLEKAGLVSRRDDPCLDNNAADENGPQYLGYLTSFSYALT